MIHQSHLDAIVDCNFRIPELSMSKPTQEEKKIGRLIADNLVEDGATLQMGMNFVTGDSADFTEPSMHFDKLFVCLLLCSMPNYLKLYKR